MLRSHTNVGHMTLDDYVEVVAGIYHAHDKNRSIWDVWCHTLHHAACMTEQIRIGATNADLHDEIADLSLWLFTALSKLQGNFGQAEGTGAPTDRFIRIRSRCSDLLWASYPNVCPHCLTEEASDSSSRRWPSEYLRRCECPGFPKVSEGENARRDRIDNSKKYGEQNPTGKPVSINEWQEMFATLFATSIRTLSLADLALRLMEALGQASDAMIRMYSYKEKDFVKGEPNRRQSSLEARLADIFSWLFVTVEKLQQLEARNEDEGSGAFAQPEARIYLSRIIWDRYGSEERGEFHCSTCNTAVCRCDIILVPYTRSAEALIEKYL